MAEALVLGILCFDIGWLKSVASLSRMKTRREEAYLSG